MRSVCLSIAIFFICHSVFYSVSWSIYHPNLFFLPGEDDADDKSAGSAGTEYDDIEEQAHDVSHSQTHDEDDPDLPLLPKRPETLLGTALKFKPPHCVCVLFLCTCENICDFCR